MQSSCSLSIVLHAEQKHKHDCIPCFFVWNPNVVLGEKELEESVIIVIILQKFAVHLLHIAFAWFLCDCACTKLFSNITWVILLHIIHIPLGKVLFFSKSLVSQAATQKPPWQDSLIFSLLSELFKQVWCKSMSINKWALLVKIPQHRPESKKFLSMQPTCHKALSLEGLLQVS